ncbi:MAG: NADH-quinone oxidoreductase subunit L, partial [Gammaproteobacteria bacterium]
MVDLKNLSLIIALAPLVGSIIAGIFGPKIGKRGAHTITILGMIIAFILSLIVGKAIFIDHVNPFNDTIYTWGVSGAYRFDIGFMIDRLSSLLMIVVTFVSVMVHSYSFGFMFDVPG